MIGVYTNNNYKQITNSILTKPAAKLNLLIQSLNRIATLVLDHGTFQIKGSCCDLRPAL